MGSPGRSGGKRGFSHGNVIKRDGDILLIELTNGTIAKCNARHYNLVSKLTWTGRSGKVTTNKLNGANRWAESLGRVLLGLKYGDPRLVVHHDGDALNCLDSNISVGTRSDKLQNVYRLRREAATHAE